MLKRMRQFHLYSGLFFAPTLIFFAFSGVLQTFGFHKEPGPAWIAAIAEVHKNQRIPAPRQEQPSASADGELKKPKSPKPPARAKSFPLQVFITIMSVGLIASAFSGIFMAFAYERKKPVIFGLLIAGTLIPIGFLFF